MSRRAKDDEDVGFSKPLVIAKTQGNNMLHNNNQYTHNRSFIAANNSSVQQQQNRQYQNVSAFLTIPHHSDEQDSHNGYAQDQGFVNTDRCNGRFKTSGGLEDTLQNLISSDNVISFAQGIEVDDGDSCCSASASSNIHKSTDRHASSSYRKSSGGLKTSSSSSSSKARKQQQVHSSISKLMGVS